LGIDFKSVLYKTHFKLFTSRLEKWKYQVRSIFKEFLNLSKIDRTFCIFNYGWRKRPRLCYLIKKLRILPINVGRTNVQNPLDFVTALLVDRHKRGRLRHRGGNTSHSDKTGEWKVGIGNKEPNKNSKITIGISNGKIIKVNK